jgi:predicted permease
MDRLAIACCAFGNTFTLPLVFLVEVLGSIHGDRVAGYIALYLVGWSPTLWTGKGLSQ